MSNKLLDICWPLKMSPSQKSVLITLADQANDKAACWPSLRSICERTCLSERAVRNAIAWLVEEGHIGRRERAGNSAVYMVTPRHEMPPIEADDPGTRCRPTPARDAAPPRHEMPPTPAPDAGDPGTRCPLTLKNHQLTLNPSPASARESRSKVDERFERFWSAYPRKVGKLSAQRAWQKRKPDDLLLHQMLKAVEWQKRKPEWVKDGGQFIPHPATWLNGGRWMDEKPEHSEQARRDPYALGTI